MHEPKSRTEHLRPKDRIGYQRAPDLGCRRALVVDDERDIRDLVALMLESRGVDVVVAGNGEEACHAFARDSDGIDVVLLDLTMPHTDPVEVLRSIRARSSEVSVILMSGYAQGVALSPEVHGFAGFLQKPFTPQALFDAIQRIADY